MLNKYRLFSLSLLIVPATLFPMGIHPGNKGKEKEKETVSYRPFYGTTTEEMEQVFEVAPLDAKNIVRHLKNPSFFGRGDYRAAFFVGEPGVGKTTLAKAIGYKMHPDWVCKFMTTGDIAGKYRNETGINLLAKLNTAVATKHKTIIIIDEINKLFEQYQNSNYDTDNTSTDFWTFLDTQNNNDNFFLIGTMNQADKSPKQIKSRISAQYIKILAPIDPVTKKKIFLNQLIDKLTVLDSECNDQYLDSLLQPLQGWTGRDFQKLALKICNIYRREDGESEIKVIKQKHLKQAFDELEEIKKELNYDEKEETDAERQERHFVQQQMIQQVISDNQITDYHYTNYFNDTVVDYTRQKLSKEGYDKIQDILSDEQNKIFKATAKRIEQGQDKREKAKAVAQKPADSSGCSIQ